MSVQRRTGLYIGLLVAAAAGSFFLAAAPAQASHDPQAGTILYQYTDGTNGLKIVVKSRREAANDDNAGDLGSGTLQKIDYPAATLIDGPHANQIRHDVASTFYMGSVQLGNQTETYLIEVQNNRVVNWYGTTKYYLADFGITSSATYYCGDRSNEQQNFRVVLLTSDDTTGNPCEGWLNLTNNPGSFYVHANRVTTSILGNDSLFATDIFLKSPRRTNEHDWFDHKTTLTRVNGTILPYDPTIHAAVDPSNIDQNKQIVGAKICQAREKLLALVKSLPKDGDHHDDYWQVQTIPIDVAELADIGNLGVMRAAIDIFEPAYSYMKPAGQELYQQALREVAEAEEAYNNLLEARQNGTLQDGDLNIRVCQSTGIQFEIDKLDDLGTLINRAKKEAELVKALPTNYGDDPCNCARSYPDWQKKSGTLSATINLAICVTICSISRGLGKFACVILERIVDPLFKKPTDPRTCGTRGAFLKPSQQTPDRQLAQTDHAPPPAHQLISQAANQPTREGKSYVV